MSSSAASPVSSPSSTSLRRALEALAGSEPLPAGSVDAVHRHVTGCFLRLLIRALAERTSSPAAVLDAVLPLPRPSGNLPAEVRLLVDRLAAGRPYKTLAATYQQVLRLQPASEGHTYRLELSRQGRRSAGSFYTPMPVARLVAARTLAASDERLPRVFDPAMGAGVFLLAAVGVLAWRTGLPERVVAEQAIHGIDLDPHAVALAIAALALETGADPAVLAGALRGGNGLDDPEREDGRSVLLSNPPWGAALSAPERAALLGRFPALDGAFDSCKPFLALAAERCRGPFGVVMPSAFLIQDLHADVRRLLLARHAPAAGWQLAPSLLPAAAPACALVFVPRPGPATIDLARLGRAGAEPVRQVPAAAWQASGFSFADGDLRALLQRLRAELPALGQVERFRVRDGGINYNRAAVAARVLYRAVEPEHPEDLPCFRGRDFGRYTAVRRSSWLRHDAHRLLLPGERLSFAADLHRSPLRIVLRQTADLPVATLDRSGMVPGRSVLAITGESDADLCLLLAGLNSRLLAALYNLLAEEQGRVLPQVKVARLRALPLALDGVDDVASLVRARLTKSDADGALDRAIDQAIYRRYGLSAGEIALVEQQTAARGTMPRC